MDVLQFIIFVSGIFLGRQSWEVFFWGGLNKAFSGGDGGRKLKVFTHEGSLRQVPSCQLTIFASQSSHRDQLWLL